jgi:hypothetical protein
MHGMQLKLFECDDPPRPKVYSEDVLEMTLDKLMPSVMKWHGSSSGEEGEIREDVKCAIEFEDNSYEIVKYLEDTCFWSVDRDLIDVMDEVSHFRYLSHKYYVEKWVLNNGVTPKGQLGQSVSFKQKGQQVAGTIKKIIEEEAKYLVFCPELGHVESGIGTHGTYLPYEDVKLL